MLQDLGQPIAYGRTAEIYAWPAGRVLKLFYDWFDPESIETEARSSRAIHACGLPVPAVGEILRLNGRYGLVFERIEGESMWRRFQRNPWNWSRYARRCAELQIAVHGKNLQAELPSQRRTLESKIRQAAALPGRLRSRVLSALESLPDGSQLCHGDFWPGNILMTARGEIIIDWLHASLGNPLADLARTINLAFGMIQSRMVHLPFLSYGSSRVNRFENSLLQALLRLCYPAYLEAYFRLRPGSRDEYRRWLPIVAAARLSDHIPELEGTLVAQVERYL